MIATRTNVQALQQIGDPLCFKSFKAVPRQLACSRGVRAMIITRRKVAVPVDTVIAVMHGVAYEAWLCVIMCMLTAAA